MGPGYAVLAIMVLEVSAARLHELLKRCAPRLFGDAKDNEISALRILERELREENAKIRDLLIKSVGSRSGSIGGCDEIEFSVENKKIAAAEESLVSVPTEPALPTLPADVTGKDNSLDVSRKT